MDGETGRTFRNKRYLLTLYATLVFTPPASESVSGLSSGCTGAGSILTCTPVAPLRENQELKTDPLRGGSTAALGKTTI
jgi:hypothetical protein